MLSIYNHSSDNPTVNYTPKYKTCKFRIKMSDKSSTWPKMYEDSTDNAGVYIDEIHGVADETGSIGYATSWEEGPGAVFTKKITEFTRAKAFKMFGGPNFDNNVATGRWTQLYPKDGSDLSFALKFRAYRKGASTTNKNMQFMDTSSYMTVIQFLSYACSAMHEFNIGTELANIGTAMSNAKAQGEAFGQKMSNVIEDGSINTANLQEAVKAAEDLLAGLSTNSPSQVLFTFEFGMTIKPTLSVKWMIDSFTYTPSVQMDNDGYPLWVDFEVNLKTNQKLTNTQLAAILK